MENEPPEHTRLRRLVAGAFNRGHVERLRPRVRELAAAAARRGRPGRLRRGRGVRRAAAGAGDRRAARRARRRYAPQLRAWSQAIVRMYELGAVRRGGRRGGAPRRPSSPALVRELAGDRAARARATTCHRPGRGPGRRRRLTEDEVVASAVLLLNAGHEASVNVFGNGLVALLRPRACRPRRRCRPDGRGDAPLRLRAAAVRAHRDRAGRRSADVVVEPGQKIAALLGAANRDPAVFADADTFRRRPRPQPAPRLRGRRALLPRRAAGPDGAGRVAAAAARDGTPTCGWPASPSRRGTFVLRGFTSRPRAALTHRT